MKTDLSNNVIPLKDVIPEKYFHFGIAYSIKNNYLFNDENYILKLVIGIDGLPQLKVPIVHFGIFYVIYQGWPT
ncbi:DUF4806 domain-containing protein [Aphis craccivora]|uniref:DUF4806 domain-containing protein n=1 Tax=Aphis craccivora TaxID=307492 RepID=A0A6G0XM20_APHCR|nr:DUF4806 domain-containing protein [Aphis craccivora]